MLALCDCLEQTYTTVRTGGLIYDESGGKRANRTHEVLNNAVAGVVAFVQDLIVTAVSVNFGNQDWCGVIVDLPTRVIIYYDSLADKSYQKTLDDLC